MAKPSPLQQALNSALAPKTGAAGPSGNAEFNSVFTKAGIPPSWRTPILQAAKNNGMDAATLASVVGLEHGWTDSSGTLAPSHTNGVYGPAQIQMSSHPDLSLAFVSDPARSIDWMAKQFAPRLQQGESVDQIYQSAYNPGYTGPVWPSSFLSKDYVPAGVPKSPAATAATDVAVQTAKANLTDPYVDANGKPIVGAVEPPKNAIPSQSIPGDAMRLGEYTTVSKNLNETYYAYTGRNASPQEIAQFAKQPTSLYQLKMDLAGTKAFTSSPIYKATAGSYVNTAKRIYGQNYTPDAKLVAQAVALGEDQGAFENTLRSQPDYTKSQEFTGKAQDLTSAAKSIFGPRYTPSPKVIKEAVVAGLSPQAFADQLRKSPEYVKSNEFQQNFSQNYKTYTSIYGRPDDAGKETVKQAALNLWAPDQFAQYLRAQPGYTQSPEYQTKALGFLQAMGLVTGATPVLRMGTAPVNQDSTGADMAAPGAMGPPAPAVARTPGKTLVAEYAGQKGGAALYG